MPEANGAESVDTNACGAPAGQGLLEVDRGWYGWRKKKRALTTTRLLLEWDGMSSLSDVDGAVRAMESPGGLGQCPGKRRRDAPGGVDAETAAALPTWPSQAAAPTPAAVEQATAAGSRPASLTTALLTAAEGQQCAAAVMEEARAFLHEYGPDAHRAIEEQAMLNAQNDHRRKAEKEDQELMERVAEADRDFDRDCGREIGKVAPVAYHYPTDPSNHHHAMHASMPMDTADVCGAGADRSGEPQSCWAGGSTSADGGGNVPHLDTTTAAIERVPIQGQGQRQGCTAIDVNTGVIYNTGPADDGYGYGYGYSPSSASDEQSMGSQSEFSANGWSNSSTGGSAATVDSSAPWEWSMDNLPNSNTSMLVGSGCQNGMEAAPRVAAAATAQFERSPEPWMQPISAEYENGCGGNGFHRDHARTLPTIRVINGPTKEGAKAKAKAEAKAKAKEAAVQAQMADLMADLDSYSDDDPDSESESTALDDAHDGTGTYNTLGQHQQEQEQQPQQQTTQLPHAQEDAQSTPEATATPLAQAPAAHGGTVGDTEQRREQGEQQQRQQQPKQPQQEQEEATRQQLKDQVENESHARADAEMSTESDADAEVETEAALVADTIVGAAADADPDMGGDAACAERTLEEYIRVLGKRPHVKQIKNHCWQREQIDAYHKNSKLVGSHVDVFWPREQQWFSGLITGYEPDTGIKRCPTLRAGGMHAVDYDDGESLLHDLSNTKYKIISLDDIKAEYVSVFGRKAKGAKCYDVTWLRAAIKQRKEQRQQQAKQTAKKRKAAPAVAEEATPSASMMSSSDAAAAAAASGAAAMTTRTKRSKVKADNNNADGTPPPQTQAKNAKAKPKPKEKEKGKKTQQQSQEQEQPAHRTKREGRDEGEDGVDSGGDDVSGNTCPHCIKGCGKQIGHKGQHRSKITMADFISQPTLLTANCIKTDYTDNKANRPPPDIPPTQRGWVGAELIKQPVRKFFESLGAFDGMVYEVSQVRRLAEPQSSHGHRKRLGKGKGKGKGKAGGGGGGNAAGGDIEYKYTVQYSDGDQEQLSYDELKPLLLKSWRERRRLWGYPTDPDDPNGSGGGGSEDASEPAAAAAAGNSRSAATAAAGAGAAAGASGSARGGTGRQSRRSQRSTEQQEGSGVGSTSGGGRGGGTQQQQQQRQQQQQGCIRCLDGTYYAVEEICGSRRAKHGKVSQSHRLN